MLDNLLEIEVAYSMLKGGDAGEDPIDAHFKKLKTDMEVCMNHSKITKKYMYMYVWKFYNLYIPVHVNYKVTEVCLEILQLVNTCAIISKKDHKGNVSSLWTLHFFLTSISYSF